MLKWEVLVRVISTCARLYSTIASLVTKAWERRVSLRLVSLKLSHVYSGVFRHELALTTAANTYQQKKGLVEAIDLLRSRYGSKAVMRGHDLWLKGRDGKPRNDLDRAGGRRAKPVAMRDTKAMLLERGNWQLKDLTPEAWARQTQSQRQAA